MLLNCDLGESYGSWVMGRDEQAMPHIDQANIACGGHAGDPGIMRRTIRLAKKHGVRVGAHPSYPDLVGFGRRSMKLSGQELVDTLHGQIATLWGIAEIEGAVIDHVKPHGALYNDMMKTPDLLETIMQAVAALPFKPKLMIQATEKYPQHQKMATEIGVELLFEAFADRAYDDDGFLVPRSQVGAVHDHAAMMAQVSQFAKDASVTTLSGKVMSLPVESLCVHGDNDTGIQAIVEIRKTLTEAI